MILITGANGFIGKQIANYLEKQGFIVRRAIRGYSSNITTWKAPFLNSNADWTKGLSGISCVIHCAALVHKPHRNKIDFYPKFFRVNVEGTLALAQQAAATNVRRFIFLSTVKVNGESTEINNPFKEGIRIPPTDPYGLSKYEAEQSLHKLIKQTRMDIVILRLPLVYGPGAKGNFALLTKMVRYRLPLPFGSIKNKRSILAIDNLCDFIKIVISHPLAGGETFLLCDSQPISTPDLIRNISIALGVRDFIFPFPVSLLLRIASLFRFKDQITKLTNSLHVSNEKAYSLLGWIPPYCIHEVLPSYLKNKSNFER